MKLRTCQNCGAEFDRHDSTPFMFVRAGNTINCLHCLDLNYLIPQKNSGYWVVFCVALIIGFLTFSLFLAILSFMGIRLDNIGIVSAIVGTGFCIAGILVSIWVSRFILKLWNWRNGLLTLDDQYQSILDFNSWRHHRNESIHNAIVVLSFSKRI